MVRGRYDIGNYSNGSQLRKAENHALGLPCSWVGLLLAPPSTPCPRHLAQHLLGL